MSGIVQEKSKVASEVFETLDILEVYAFVRWAMKHHPDEIIAIARLYSERDK